MLLRAELAERELALTNRRAELAAFEGQYLRQVGILYAELDDWNAKIAERLAEAEGTEDAWCVAALARVRAEESSNAAHSEAATPPDFVPSEELKTIYREVVGRVHPDLASDKDDRHKHEQQIAEANAAYHRSDAEALRRMLEKFESIPGSVRVTGIAPDLVCGNLQIRKVKSRLSKIELETAILIAFDIAKLRAKVAAAKAEGRELLAEMVQDLTSRIELLRGYLSCLLAREGKSITEGDERTMALIPRRTGTLNRNGLAALAARGLMDLRTQGEEAQDWHSQGLPFQGGYDESVWCFLPGFELRTSRAASQFSLGCACLRSVVASQDYRQAAAWFRKAAAQGHGHAANNLGVLYEHALGVPQDYEQAFRWYFKAAGQGVAIAQFNLDKMYKNGRGVTRGYARVASDWYHAANENGDLIDQRNMGLMYALGKGVPPDDAEAAFWFRKAAQRGDAMAQETLGLMYALGKGVGKDRAEAVFWCCKAAHQGYEPAQQALSTLLPERRARNTKIKRSPSRVPQRILSRAPAISSGPPHLDCPVYHALP